MNQALRHISNPPNPYEAYSVEWLDEPPEIALQVFEEEAKSILSKNDSPDVGFEYSLNPYRGCFHGCAYCYARPSHQYLGFGAGTDFERKIVVKINAAEKLREQFDSRSWKGNEIVFSGNTDCYQPLEANYRLTRSCLEVCDKYQNPVGIITKGALIRRDIDILQSLNKNARVSVWISLAFADDDDSRKLEPYAPRPSIRFRAMKELAEAGIPVGVGLAPVIPGLNDIQIAEILTRAKDAGASNAFMTLLRLPAETQTVFLERLEKAFPQRANKVIHGLQILKGGVLNRSEFGKRMVGEGERWKAIEWLFEQTCERFGFPRRGDRRQRAEKKNTFRRPTPQLSLFPE